MLVRKDDKGQAIGRRIDLKLMMMQGNLVPIVGSTPSPRES
jgi:hypothetical protein